MMLDTREPRGSAAELKFLLDPDTAGRVRAWAREHMAADPHGTGACGDEYTTSTLYFDTARRDVLHRRLSFGRAKYRVRRYGGADVLFLERKLRRPGLLIKRRTLDTDSALGRLEHDLVDPAWAGAWFHKRLLTRGLTPACQITYDRTARVRAAADGLIRLTLDARLRAAAASRPRFDESDPQPLLQDGVVLELKYRDRVPALFRGLIEEFALRPGALSKYRLGMRALGQDAARERREIRPAGDAPAYA